MSPLEYTHGWLQEGWSILHWFNLWLRLQWISNNVGNEGGLKPPLTIPVQSPFNLIKKKTNFFHVPWLIKWNKFPPTIFRSKTLSPWSPESCPQTHHDKQLYLQNSYSHNASLCHWQDFKTSLKLLSQIDQAIHENTLLSITYKVYLAQCRC